MNCVSDFYNKFKKQISEIRTISQRNMVLSDMQEEFTRTIRSEPQNRNQLSEYYQLLKEECAKL